MIITIVPIFILLALDNLKYCRDYKFLNYDIKNVKIHVILFT